MIFLKFQFWPFKFKSNRENLSLWGGDGAENEWDLEMGLRRWEVREYQETNTFKTGFRILNPSSPKYLLG